MAIKDISGQKFNRLTAIKRVGKDKGGRSLWMFRCECGKEKVIEGNNVTSGKVISCGCFHKERISELCSKDLTGQRFGKLVAIKRIRDNDKNNTYYICKCDCGREVKVLHGGLQSGNSKSCGCTNKSIYYKTDMTGMKFGRLLILEQKYNKTRDIILKCQCDCGKIIEAYKSNVIKGNTQSCGCYHREVCSELLSSHNLSKLVIYKRFMKMVDRCENPNCKAYKNYGARGIRVCDEWKNDFVSFYNWAMANGYRDDLTIERIDVNGNYCPENCTFIPLSEQAKNRTNSIWITYNGETHHLAEWSRIIGLNAQTIRNRLKKYGYNHLDKVLSARRYYGTIY